MSVRQSPKTASDELLGRLATAPPRRLAGRGQADIGGRMRVASILREHGLSGAGSPVRISGSTNEVWAAGPLIIRVSFEKNSVRLRREALLLSVLSPWVRAPRVYAAGTASFGEYVVVARCPGITVSELWHQIDRAQRRNLVHEIASVVRRLHTTELSEQQHTRLWGEQKSNPLLSIEQMIEMTEMLEAFPHVDRSMMVDARACIDGLSGAFDEAEPLSLVHGDLHFENVLAQNESMTALIDFEWAHMGYAESDIDTMARFCMQPELHTMGDYKLERSEFLDVLRWFAEAYPEVFEHRRFRSRLDLCAYSYELPALLKSPPDGPRNTLPSWHPINRLGELVNFGPAAVVLGW